MFHIIGSFTAALNKVVVLAASRETIMEALLVMGKGMLGIFIALSIVFGFTILLTKVFPTDKKKNNDEEQAQ